jgi:pimeloyl-ACP methyl ester carboxylesterase
MADIKTREVKVQAGRVTRDGDLTIPKGAEGIVLFVHGSGSSRFSTTYRYVAAALNRAGLATLLFDLLTTEEERVDQHTLHLRFDIGLLTQRTIGAVDWVKELEHTRHLNLGLFGSSTGGAAALWAASNRPDAVAGVVSRGGRPDLTPPEQLARVRAPVLLIVGGNDTQVIEMNREAAMMLQAPHRLAIIPAASHLFEEPGKLEEMTDTARSWFAQVLSSSWSTAEPPPASPPVGGT